VPVESARVDVETAVQTPQSVPQDLPPFEQLLQAVELLDLRVVTLFQQGKEYALKEQESHQARGPY
jgi:hypothetical protein